MDWKTLFLSADGRIGRQSFWIGALILFAAGVVLGWIPIIGWLIGLALIYCWVCLYSKRLHDFGRTGWLAAVPIVLIILLIVVGVAGMGSMGAMGGYSGHDSTMAGRMMGGGMMGGGGGLFALSALISLVAIGFLLWVGLTPSDPAANKYGEPPAASPLPQG